MDDQHDLSELEIIGIAAAAAAALGGLVIGLSRGQERSARSQVMESLPDERVSDVAERARARLPQIRETVQHGVRSAMDELPNVTQRSQRSVQSRLPDTSDLQGQMTTRLGQLGSLAKSAVQSTQDRLESGQSATEMVRPLAEDVKSRVSHALEQRQRPEMSESTAKVGQTMDALRDRAESTLREQRERAQAMSQDLSHETSDAGRRLAKKSGSVAKETTMTVIWLSAASALIYFILMSPERREQVKGFLCGGLEQARLLALDLRGYEPEY